MIDNNKESAVLKIRKSTLKEIENAKIKFIEIAKKFGNKKQEEALNSM